MKTQPIDHPALPQNSEGVTIFSRSLVFPDIPCPLGRIREFRGEVNALLRPAGVDNSLFHNHMGGGYRYAYPALQYRSVNFRGKPVAGLWGLDQAGRQAIEAFESTLFIPQNLTDPKLVRWKHYTSHTEQTTIELTTFAKEYLIRAFALNHQQARFWADNPSRRKQDVLLQKALRFAIFGFLNAIGYWVPDHLLEIRILDIPQGTWLMAPPLQRFDGKRPKGPVLVMDVEFDVNIPLPEGVGLGIHKAFGWGVVQSLG